MVEQIDLGQVNWARAQFALTAMYHWIFVPLTLGLSFLVAFFESIYVATGKKSWKNLTKFWMTLFGINFAIGVATGIIMEFEFGTNWSNYSWMVGDIFGAPLAVEGILAFFLEASFFAVMFFGWDRVSKSFHLFSSWMVAIGSNLSALWILVANGWMQNPVGMAFNPDTARFEMESFWTILLSPTAIAKFTHTTSSSFLLASLFVVGVSSWYLLKDRHVKMAKRSLVVASVFGLLSSLLVGLTGDESAYDVAQTQPMKLAAMEGLYDGEENAPLIVFGLINSGKEPGDDMDPFTLKAEVPAVLSLLANREFNSFVPGINDLVFGNEEHDIIPAATRMERGRQALVQLAAYKKAQEAEQDTSAILAKFNEYKDDMGYGHLANPSDLMPPVATTYYAFHIMVILGTLFPLVFLAILFYVNNGRLERQRWLHLLGVACIPLAWVASQAGWVVAEVGRQPWAIQGMLPVNVASTNLPSGTVQTTFMIFLGLFTLLLIAEVKIMLKQINIGPEEE
ncbi:MAG: cytochrome ubiquinol oxidase subunit I [Thermodesulfobacteriota bacterium]